MALAATIVRVPRLHRVAARHFLRNQVQWKVSEDVRPIALPQRDAWLAEATKDGGIPSHVQRRRELRCDGFGVGKTGTPQPRQPVPV
jgi:hypothetical protein